MAKNCRRHQRMRTFSRIEEKMERPKPTTLRVPLQPCRNSNRKLDTHGWLGDKSKHKLIDLQQVQLQSVKLSEDRKSVDLELEELKPAMYTNKNWLKF